MAEQRTPTAVPFVPGYVLEELLGRGGSGQVWRGRPRGGGPAVAIKVLVRGDAARQEREAALLGELDHPHLVRLHEVVRHEVRGGPAEVALVLDLLTGGSLASLLARRGRLRPGEVVTTVAPVAAALAHAHARGVVHGDLSPGNIVFTGEGRPVLTDLGTARLVGDAARAEVTPAYVDPVVARGGAPGPASDVFGVAAAAFHALTGIAPWNAADPAGTLAVAGGGELPDLALLAPEAPEELVRVVQRGLAAEPHRRGSAAEFALDLRHGCRPEPVRLPVAGVPDAELGRTGAGPQTELTHQVPGARPRAAHAAPAPTGRAAGLRARLARRRRDDGERAGAERLGVLAAGLRRLAVIGGVLLAVAGALAGVAWAGASWGGSDTVPAAGAAVAGGSSSTPGTPPAVKSAAPPAPDPAGAPAPPAPPSPPPTSSGPVPDMDGPGAGPETPAADRPGPPGDDAGWTSVLTELYARRAAAVARADATALAGVYAPGSALIERDAASIRALADARQSPTGFSPQLVRLLSVTADGPGRFVLRVVDELPDYQVVSLADAGAPAQEVPGRGATPVRLVLTQTPAGWRITEAAVQP